MIWRSQMVFVVGFLMVGVSAFGSVAPTSGRADISTVKGLVTDIQTGEPIVGVTIQVLGQGRSTLTNDEGRYQLRLTAGNHILKFTHVGYYTRIDSVALADRLLDHPVTLQAAVIDLGERHVYARKTDAAQQIILEAIARKQEILNRLQKYQFEAYTKITFRDRTKPDSVNITLLAESQNGCRWEKPDRFHETLTSRRQSANIKAENNLMGVGQILNFNANRIELAGRSAVSPTATDALDHYNYYLMDTLVLDNRPVFLLEVEPKNEFLPLFIGTIRIVDSTFDVVGVDVWFSRGFQFGMIDSARYRQQFAYVDDRYWMPVEIRMDALFSLAVPIPGLPGKLGVSYVASLYQYRFEEAVAAPAFERFDFVVDPDADKFDSAQWKLRQTIPLTLEEERGYDRIDSLKRVPKPIYKVIPLGILAAGAVAMSQPGLFHYNRVEGPYVGLANTFRRGRWNLSAGGGYAFDADQWQHAYLLGWTADQNLGLRFGAGYRDAIVKTPLAVTAGFRNPTLLALWFNVDPFSYYHARGWEYSASITPMRHLTLSLGYRHERHATEQVNNAYNIFDDETPPQPNAAITEGRFRSLTATIGLDTRRRVLDKGREFPISGGSWTRAELGIEYAPSTVILSEVAFRRYWLDLRIRTMALGMGVTTVRGFAGGSDGELPVQRKFVVDHGGIYFDEEGVPMTLYRQNFGGDKAAGLFVDHNFQNRPLAQSGIPGVRSLPFFFHLHGGLFWTESQPSADAPFPDARRAYRELGFGLSNLSPFLSPFNFKLDFTWQLSDYNTRDFTVEFGFDM